MIFYIPIYILLSLKNYSWCYFSFQSYLFMDEENIFPLSMLTNKLFSFMLTLCKSNYMSSDAFNGLKWVDNCQSYHWIWTILRFLDHRSVINQWRCWKIVTVKPSITSDFKIFHWLANGVIIYTLIHKPTTQWNSHAHSSSICFYLF